MGSPSSFFNLSVLVFIKKTGYQKLHRNIANSVLKQEALRLVSGHDCRSFKEKFLAVVNTK